MDYGGFYHWIFCFSEETGLNDLVRRLRYKKEYITARSEQQPEREMDAGSHLTQELYYKLAKQ